MRLDKLTEAIREDLAAGRKPFAVIATAGTTNTGSIDPLDQIAQICQEYNLWMHVDGAFGASLLLSPRYRGQLKGIERSDSMSWDAHKWLMQTYGCSMVLLRDRSKLLQSFSTHPEYLRDAETSDDNPNFWDLGPELTRPARGLKLWITLQVMGSEGLGRVIEHGCKMAQLAEKTIMEYPHWEMISHAQQGIVNFRYAPTHATEQELDLLNLQIHRHRIRADSDHRAQRQAGTAHVHPQPTNHRGGYCPHHFPAQSDPRCRPAAAIQKSFLKIQQELRKRSSLF